MNPRAEKKQLNWVNGSLWTQRFPTECHTDEAPRLPRGPPTLVLQVAPLLPLLVGLPLVVRGAVLHHHLVLLQRRQARLQALPPVTLQGHQVAHERGRWGGEGEEDIQTPLIQLTFFTDRHEQGKVGSGSCNLNIGSVLSASQHSGGWCLYRWHCQNTLTNLTKIVQTDN